MGAAARANPVNSARLLACGLLAVTLAGCGTTSTVKVDAAVPASTSFTLQDDRPAAQRVSRVDNSPYAENTYFGDDNLEPAPPDLLRAWLYKHMAPELAGKRLSLSEFSVNVYEPAVFVDQNRVNSAAQSVQGGAAAAPLAGLFIHGIERIKSEKIVRIRIQAKVEAGEFSTIVSERYRGRVTEENIQAALFLALDQFVADVRSGLGADKKGEAK